MPTENTSLKNTTPAADSNTSHDMNIGKFNTYQRPLLIVAGSLLAFAVLMAVTGTHGGQYLTSSTAKITKGGAAALAEYHVDNGTSEFTKDIFGMGVVSKKYQGFSCTHCCDICGSDDSCCFPGICDCSGICD